MSHPVDCFEISVTGCWPHPQGDCAAALALTVEKEERAPDKDHHHRIGKEDLLESSENRDQRPLAPIDSTPVDWNPKVN